MEIGANPKPSFRQKIRDKMAISIAGFLRKEKHHFYQMGVEHATGKIVISEKEQSKWTREQKDFFHQGYSFLISGLKEESKYLLRKEKHHFYQMGVEHATGKIVIK